MGVKSDILRILQIELDRLHDTARDHKDPHNLLMTAHTIGVMQRIVKQIQNEVVDDLR